MVVQGVRCSFQIERFPQHNGGCHRVETGSAVALLPEAAVADFTRAVEEHSTSQRLARFALVKPDMHAAEQLDALQPVQDEQRTLDCGPARAVRPPGRSGVGSGQA